MASNQRLLKAYLRYDDSGRISPGSLVLRGNMPKGRGWVEVPAYECCNAFVSMSYAVSTGGEPGTICAYGFDIYCGVDRVIGSPFDFGNTIVSVLAGLNSTYGFLGQWTAPDSGTIQLNMKDAIAKELCPSGTLSIQLPCGG